jgi:hypothetical protein
VWCLHQWGVTEASSNLGLDFNDRSVRFLIRDRDSNCRGPVDQVFPREGIGIVKEPARAPEANNAIAERVVRSVRSDVSTDGLLPSGRP